MVKPAATKRTRTDRIAALEAKKAALVAQLEKLRQKETAEERKRDTRRKIIVGGAVLAHAKIDAAFAAALAGVLAKAVQRDADREAIADLLSSESGARAGARKSA